MTKYIDYASLSATHRLHFNSTGEFPQEYVLTEAQWQVMLGDIARVQACSGEVSVGEGEGKQTGLSGENNVILVDFKRGNE